MGRFVDGKIFIVHTEDEVPMVAFLFFAEAERVMEEFKSTGIESYVKEVHCFGNGLQRIFALMYDKGTKHIVIAYTSLKDANSMCKILAETQASYTVSEISCFEVMRKQPLAKYKLKYGNNTVDESESTLAYDAHQPAAGNMDG